MVKQCRLTTANNKRTMLQSNTTEQYYGAKLRRNATEQYYGETYGTMLRNNCKLYTCYVIELSLSKLCHLLDQMQKKVNIQRVCGLQKCKIPTSFPGDWAVYSCAMRNDYQHQAVEIIWQICWRVYNQSCASFPIGKLFH